MKKHIVIAGLGDTGLLVALNLNKKFPGQYKITGITSKPCLVSGQELGTRLSRPELWKKNYLVAFNRYKQIDGIDYLQAKINRIDPTDKQLVYSVENQEKFLNYDILVISSGVTNGFWRNNKFQNLGEIEQEIATHAEQIKACDDIAIIGGGPSGVSCASNLKQQYPEKNLHLYYSREHILPGYHQKTVDFVEQQLNTQGVFLHKKHRALAPENFNFNDFSSGTIQWQTGQADSQHQLIIWATGQLQANNQFIPEDMLSTDGFVKTNEYLQVPGYPEIFTVGDIADSDPNRSSARNAGFLTVAYNIHALLNNKKLKTYKASQYRWGSVLGIQNTGMRVFTPTGGNINISPWWVKTILFPVFVHRLIYKGIKKLG